MRVLVVCLLWLWWWGSAWWCGWQAVAAQPRRFARKRVPEVTRTTRRKPAWATQEVLRLKVLMGHAGCRQIAATFTLLASGRLVEVVPDTDMAAPLYWHHWKLELPLSNEVTRVITTHAHRALEQSPIAIDR